jgi:hypothetical protein
MTIRDLDALVHFMPRSWHEFSEGPRVTTSTASDVYYDPYDVDIDRNYCDRASCCPAGSMLWLRWNRLPGS